MSDDDDFGQDVPDDHDLIRERREPADRTGARVYTAWREILRTPDPVFGKAKSRFPITHPWWPVQGHPDNTDRHYDDHCEMFGEIPDYLPSVKRGYRGTRMTQEDYDGESEVRPECETGPEGCAGGPGTGKPSGAP